ncbi:DUF7310 family coiled-coil domain-containing protein [Haloarcula marina]|uniref:DUF7310 family coiled-coil domain-containing protein n=1 Tax=Haloarcula marina TaxID=2961574 RepID=UPI0020B80524|nr:hypothetical protein [Halomicroarcula marina]
MTDVETLAERVQTVERAVTDGDHEFPEATDLAELEGRVAALERRLTGIDERTTELEAATQALRGYVGNVESVNERVEERADAALAATDRLERRLDTAVNESAGTTVRPERRERPAQTPEPDQFSGPDGDQHHRTPATRDPPSETAVAGVREGGIDHSAAPTESAKAPESAEESGVIERIRALL